METLNKLVAMGRKLLFVTNNSTKSRKEYRCKFDGIGLDFRVEETDVVTATFAVAEFLRVRTPHVKRVLVIGASKGGRSWVRGAGPLAGPAAWQAARRPGTTCLFLPTAHGRGTGLLWPGSVSPPLSCRLCWPLR